MKRLFFYVFIPIVGLFSCKPTPLQQVEKYTAQDAEYLRRCEKKLTDIIVIDIFSPPVASRVYSYPLLAGYEAARYAQPGVSSITSRLHDFENMPIPIEGEEYDFTLATVKAFCTTAREVIFAKKEMEAFEAEILAELSKRNKQVVSERSIEFGLAIANTVISRLKTDNYKETRTMERFEVKAEPGFWVPTLPNYEDALEPHWTKMKAFVLDSADQYRPAPPIPFSRDVKSPFWKQVVEVHDVVRNFTPEQEEITIFWDDNPFVSRVKGHLMFGDKKMTPGGHWIAISRIISRSKGSDLVETAKAYALTSIALYDAFISCWDAKYTYNFVRPETVINDEIDNKWRPLLVAPPFPSYTSGHSTISASAAEALTSVFGDNLAYTDTTEREYGLPVRSFTSFRQAALEASISRVYGGIHYTMDCNSGNDQGRKIGTYIVEKLQ